MGHFPSPDEVKGALDAYRPIHVPALPGRKNHILTGVMVPIAWRPDPIVIVTQRTSNLRHHAGEICFPGGRPAEEDTDLWTTAMREAQEELGIVKPRLLGSLSAMPIYTSDFRLVPFVAQVTDELKPSPDEVREVIYIRVRSVLELEYIDAIPFDWDGVVHHSPVFLTGTRPMYGATAHTFCELLELLAPLFGLRLPPFRTGRFDWADFHQS